MNCVALSLASLLFVSAQAQPAPASAAPPSETSAPSSTSQAAPDDELQQPPADTSASSTTDTPDVAALKAALAQLKAAAMKGDLAQFKALLTPEHNALLDELAQLAAADEAAAGYAPAAVLKAYGDRQAVFMAADVQGDKASVKVQTLGVVDVLPFVNTATGWKLDAPATLSVERDRLQQRAADRAAAQQQANAAKPDNHDGHDHAGHDHDGHDHNHDHAASRPATDGAGVSLQNAAWYAQIFDGNSYWHYTLYAPDYAFIGVTGGLYLSGVYDLIPPMPALIGPQLSREDPDLRVMNDPRLDGVIGRPYLSEKVPTLALVVAGVGAIGAAGVHDGIRHTSFHHTHAFTVGALTAVLSTVTAVEVTKTVVGRLRPDYRDRYTRAACGGAVDDDRINCDAFDGFGLTDEDLHDGRRSFPSGHSATAFSLATYLSLYLGGEYLWGEGATAASMPIAAGLMGVLYAGAMYSAASRLGDNRHHPEDVAVGAALGTGMAAASYFLHFDLQGDARYRAARVSAMVTEDGQGGGVQVSGTF